jgi:hypothetical protein
MQLDACLRSIHHYGPYGGSIVVIYRATTEAFAQGYRELAPHSRVQLHEQGNDFKSDVVDAVGTAGGHVVFHTDDDLFFRRPPGPLVLPDGCACLSLRLGENTTYCYPLGRGQRLPRFERCDEWVLWDWSVADADFAYPMSLNGHVFDVTLLRPLIAGAAFGDPNDLERELHFERHRLPRLMLSLRFNSVISVPVNVVTESVVNKSGVDPNLSHEALNDRFLGGERIDLARLELDEVCGAHQEMEFVFARNEITLAD